MLESKKKLGNELYQSLGKLFYAMAMADHSIHVQEMKKLNEVVRDYWLEVDDIEDEYGSDAAFQIVSVFDWLLEYEKDGEEIYEEFEAFYTDNKVLFTPQIKNLAMSTSRAIIASFSGSNKSELIVLGRLQLLFNN
ncbi:hypothetical protein [Flagellimonas halotolerans]|uniref:Uncharacterized protein n=1 Tax=Flagellimonas halotolerans TaxID=3112164 RepID=A0ABU6ITH8_9FLAO|nr:MULTISPECIES: hypothetical protein [unclassified Allomuricauda]MEC3966431.1 hypothetical protein [Muricauda sp. SYSU M86414]MEC4266296.1 hypothetical protein [Muricauda sp. SYSU M84420]